MVLDARPGGIIYRDIIPGYVKFVRTIYEGFIFPSIFSTIQLLAISCLFSIIARVLNDQNQHGERVGLTPVSWSCPDDFGDVAVDINYLNVGDMVPDYQIFIC